MTFQDYTSTIYSAGAVESNKAQRTAALPRKLSGLPRLLVRRSFRKVLECGCPLSLFSELSYSSNQLCEPSKSKNQESIYEIQPLLFSSQIHRHSRRRNHVHDR